MNNTTNDTESCVNCGLSRKVPGVELSGNGICQHCRFQDDVAVSSRQKQSWRNKFFDLIAQLPREGDYDCLMSYSGGKDSTYTLLMLTEDYGLRVLAVVFDQGFVSERTRRNIDMVTDAANVDCFFIKPNFDAVRDLFTASLTEDLYSPKALERTSAICVSCMSLIKGAMLALAIEKRIPFVAYGWSPGQAHLKSSIIRMNPDLIRAVQTPIHQAVRSIVGDRLDGFFLQQRHLGDAEHFPTYVHPLAFENYDEDVIYRRIEAYGWEKPLDTDATSTNCLLNAFANTAHLERYGYHPYAHEYAALVRQGVMSRDEAARRMESRAPDAIMEFVTERLELHGEITGR